MIATSTAQGPFHKGAFQESRRYLKTVLWPSRALRQSASLPLSQQLELQALPVQH